MPVGACEDACNLTALCKAKSLRIASLFALRYLTFFVRMTNKVETRSLNKTKKEQEVNDDCSSTETTYLEESESFDTMADTIREVRQKQFCFDEKDDAHTYTTVSLSSSSVNNDSVSSNDERQPQGVLLHYPSDEEASCCSVCSDSSPSDDDSLSCASNESDSDSDDSSCCSSSTDSSLIGKTCSMTNADPNDFVRPKALPAPTNTYKVVCLSFLEPNISTSVASKVFEESLRMLKKGGLIYVVDKGTVQKLPKFRQMLSRVIVPTVKHKVHDIETQEILQANGFALDENRADDEHDEEIVRWMGIKP